MLYCVVMSKNPLIASFQLLSAVSLNLGWSQNGILGNWLTNYHTMPHFEALKIHSSGKHCEKSRNCL